MRVARLVSRAIGWVFVAAIAYHAVLAAVDAARAGSDGHWGRAVALILIALVATALVVGAVLNALRLRRR